MDFNKDKESKKEIKRELEGTASSHNRVLYLQRLLEKTHNLNAQDKNGNTVLMHALELESKENFDSIKFTKGFINRGIDVNILNKD